jgi:uncharacterized protein YecE (DUF72 family)
MPARTRSPAAGQLGLFGDPAPPAGLVWPPEVAALGARLAEWPLYLGTSSWAFPGWAGLVYPPGMPAADLPARGLAWYAQHPLLRTVGIDRSYYGALSASDYRAYAAQVPAGFRFLAKADRTLTTPAGQLPSGYRVAPDAFLDPGRLRAACIDPLLEGLGPGRGGLILQFPPLGNRYCRDPAAFAAALGRALGQALAGLPAGLDCFVEVRNAELLTADYVAALAATGAQHCYSVHPGAAPLAEQAERLAGLVGGPLLVRWNLQRDRVYEEARAEFAPFNRLAAPDPGTRSAAARLVLAALGAGRTATVLANNKAEGCAPLTLLELARMIAAGLPPGTNPGPS